MKPEGKQPPFLSPLFADHMVIQREMRVPVWGWAQPGAAVTVEMAGETAYAVAGPDGRWEARLGPFAAGGPHTLTVRGPAQASVRDVLVGDVWLCSGQSNMEMGIGDANDGAAEADAADDSLLRLYTVPQCVAGEARREMGGEWLPCTPETIRRGVWAGFSATAYYFGRALRVSQGVPVGLIHASWGGTPVEAWTSYQALEAEAPEMRPVLAAVDDAVARVKGGGHDHMRTLNAWITARDPGFNAGWHDEALDASGWNEIKLPVIWQQCGHADIEAVVWLRKEVDLPDAAAGRPATLHLGAVHDADATWVNGVPVGSGEGWWMPRSYAVPEGTLRAGRNTIAIRAVDIAGDGGFLGADGDMRLEISGGETVPLCGSWAYRPGVSKAGLTGVRPLDVERNMNVPTVLYNGMIAPLIPFGIKGAIWYQGEANAPRAAQYRTLLPTMIRDWRARWNEGDFPFFIVQLANFMQRNPEPVESDWAELREAQALTAQSLPNTGLAVAIDIGDANDIHPKNKQEVGRRLALSARAIAYGDDIEYSGPVYASKAIEGNKVVLTFTHAKGLTAKGGKLTGFQIAGADRKWFWADAAINRDTVTVSSPSVPAPVAVRYAWQNNPACNLYNAAGLPAVPFRTDDWPGITDGIQ